jgi:branched-chain amino acid transport system ATP-binding protein
VVLAEGRVIAEGPHSSIGGNEAVVDAYLGRHHGAQLDLSDDLAPDADRVQERSR